MKKIFFCIISCTLFLGCSPKVKKNFNYQKLLTPDQVKSDIEDLKKNLLTKHYNIDWEGKKESIFKALDNIKNTDSKITIDSFEHQLKRIIDNIDDGHSRLVHQDSFKTKNRNQFGYQTISDSIKYLRIGNFRETIPLIETLEKLRIDFQNNQPEILIIDIRSNKGGNAHNVNIMLTYFLPSKSKMYERIDSRSNSMFTRLVGKASFVKQDLKRFKYTGEKKIDANPKIYLWINESIASASMLLSYHLQNHGATIIGETPKGLFSTFGNAYRYKLKESKIIYHLSAIKVILSDKPVERLEDMLKPSYVPTSTWNLSDFVNYINSN